MNLPQFARVTVNVPSVTGVFDYRIPEMLLPLAAPGCLVVVPFGKQNVQGIILELLDAPSIEETRPITSLIDPSPVLTPYQISLAKIIAEETLSPLAVCLTLMLPPGLSQLSDLLYHFTAPVESEKPVLTNLSPLQQKIISIFDKKGDLRGRQIDALFSHQDWRKAIKPLEKLGLVTNRPVLPAPGIRPRVVRTVQLSCLPEEVEEYASGLEKLPLNRKPAAERRLAVLHFLLKEPWPVEAAWVYASTGASLPDLYRLAEDGKVILSEIQIWRDPLAEIEWAPYLAPILTSNQQTVLAAILNEIEQGAENPCLLHGISGSGKTEIYLQAAAKVIESGRQVFVLVPEISLTPQTVHRFLGRFPGQVGLIHSRLSPGERYDTWQRVRNGKLNIIIGPRSALFSPFPNPGLIILDECHDDSYAQSDTPPRFSAVQAAIHLGKICKAGVILGTATPPVELFYRAQQEKWKILNLPRRILAHRLAVQNHLDQQTMTNQATSSIEAPTRLSDEIETGILPPVTVVDMRKELKSGNRTMFSKALTDALTQVLQNNQQAILYLNRRGAATFVFCRDCGSSLRCLRCDLPLTWHSDEKILICHICRYQRKMPEKCPQCGGTQIRQYGAGTEKVEAEVNLRFPAARTLRWDAETARLKGADEIILSHFSNHRADILIGTQMIAKGLDLPLVTLVGVILADVGLNFPDYRAGERTFQLLTQVAGRASRSALGGQAIFQTFQPENYVLQCAARHDFHRFYEVEMEYRRRLGYPPFNRLIRLEYRHPKSELAEKVAFNLAEQINHWLVEGRFSATEIIGPAPCYFHKWNGQYRWQIILKGPNPALVLKEKNLSDWRVEVDPVSVL